MVVCGISVSQTATLTREQHFVVSELHVVTHRAR
jgi:hypothetical protein